MTGPTRTEASVLLKAAINDDDPRALLILSMLRYEGYRENEIRQIDYEDVDLRHHTVTMIRKKRSTPSTYPLSSRTVDALEGWLKVRGRDNGPLLYGGPHGTNSERRIGKTSIYYIVQKIAKKVGLSTSPCKIRHRACTDLIWMAEKTRLPEGELLFLSGHTTRAGLAPYYDASKSRKKARAVLNSLDELVDEDDDAA